VTTGVADRVSEKADGSSPVFVDADKIHQVIINLLDNAVQHSPDGSEVVLLLSPAADSVTGFQVVDAGAGVPAEDLPHVFEPFYTKRREGTGLGLSIVKHITLVGDFNDWDPAARRMVKTRDGSFRAKLELAPGEYQYKFVVDGQWLHDPEAATHVANEHGTLNNSVVQV